MRWWLVFLFLFYFFPYSGFSQAEIIGGENADIEDYPYQAALLYNSGGWSYAYCGASIINQYWILTAAHCVEGESTNTTVVRVGSDNSYAQGGSTYDADEIIIHNNYNSNTMNNDIALIKLDNPISFNNFKQPVIVMCDEQVDLGVQDPGEMSWVTGWGDTEGTTNSSQLQVVGVPITTQSDYGWGQIDADMIMAGYSDGGYDSCQGDSGGPMVVLSADGETYLQCGIVSWGSGCADAGYPGVYTRVSYFINWICDNTDGDVCANESYFCTGNTIYGCTDITAENYNPEATLDDGSCEYACDQTVSLVITFDCWPEETGWSITNETGGIVSSENSGSYNGSSTTESICLPEGCYTFTITDSYGDGLGGSQWGGCNTDGSYEISDDGDVLVSGEGDFGSSISHEFCITGDVLGCADSDACNYNSAANDDDGSCVYPEEYYDCNGICLNDEDGDGICDELEIPGCTDMAATNYNLEATDNDGSCVYPVIGCIDPTACNYNPEAIEEDGSCVYPEEYYDCNGICLNDEDGDGICDELEIPGCTDMAATNYNLEATGNDGSCVYPVIGCIDPTACNYNPEAIEEDGSCVYPEEYYDCNGICLNDEDGDGICDELEIPGCTDMATTNYNPEATDNDGSCVYSDLDSQTITLEQGWNTWSTYIEATGGMSSVFEEIEENVIIVKDQNGNVYWPEYELNSIGGLTIGEGYQAKMSQLSDLVISGLVVPYNQEIPLVEGWNIMGYLHQDLGDIVQFFEPYADGVVIIKDEDGNVYWPEYELNSIGNMSPGEGYQIKTSVYLSFSYQDLIDGRFSLIGEANSMHFEQPKITGNNMTILFPFEIIKEFLNENDELAVYDQHGLLVGSSVVTNGHTVITVWGDDITTLYKDGMSEGEEILFKVWQAHTDIESDIEIICSEGNSFYGINAISIVGEIMAEGIELSSPIQLIKTIDLLGREVDKTEKNILHLSIYNDGSVNKQYVID